MTQRTNPAGIALIERFEGLKLKAYQDGNGIWTIGYGHAQAHKDEYETQEQAEADLCADLATAEAAVCRLVPVELNTNQFSALVSFTYNEGAGRLQTSTLDKLLKAGDYAGAASQFAVWDIIAGKVSAGLVLRREAERVLFLTQPV